MNHPPCILTALLLAALVNTLPAADQPRPIAVHPDNPHYYLFRDKPTILVTSGEHYGAVLNLDFDYLKYLDTLQADGMNLTRTFSGVYLEPPGAFGITRNTLAPAKGRYLARSARSGDKYDLAHYDDAYSKRLKDFVAEAGKRGIVVEMVLFCTVYEDMQWNLSPMNAANNINGVGNVKNTQVHTLDNGDGLLAVQKALTRKIVTELKDADNLYYEICNEPYFAGVSIDWQQYIADVIHDAEKDFPARHLIAQNIANKSAKVTNLQSHVTILNFHYAAPESVLSNYALNHPINCDETGFAGTFDAPYLAEAWNFFMAGGGGYSGLDYSFAAGWEDGTFPYPRSQPGAGSPAFRRELRILKQFLESFDLLKLRPLDNVKGARALAEPGRQYALYATGKVAELDIPAATYEAQWLNIHTGEIVTRQTLTHPGGPAHLDFNQAQAIRLISMTPSKPLAVAEDGRFAGPDKTERVFICDDAARTSVIEAGKSSRPCRVEPIGLAHVGPAGAMDLKGGSFLADLASCDAILQSCRKSNEISVEATLAPANVEQTGAILAFSTADKGANFLMAQENDHLLFQLRTSDGKNASISLCPLTAARAQHLLITYKSGELIAYVDGKKIPAADSPRGDLKNWSPARLIFGDVFSGGRKWKGSIGAVMIYDKAVDPPAN